LHGDGVAFAFPIEAIFPPHRQVLEGDLRIKGGTARIGITLPMRSPGAPRSTTKAEIFGLASPSDCVAEILRSAAGALVM
jgi:hypothetical protein